jgi:hypothetical protein
MGSSRGPGGAIGQRGSRQLGGVNYGIINYINTKAKGHDQNPPVCKIYESFEQGLDLHFK